MTSITVSAPGKTILHGEHAVVFGKGAIAVSLGLRTRVTLTTDACSYLEVKFDCLNYERKLKLPEKISVNISVDSGSDVIPVCATYLKEISENFHIELLQGNKTEQAITTMLYLYTAMTQKYGNGVPRGACIRVSSDLAIGAGLGSSASYAVTVSTVFLCLYDVIEQSPKIPNSHLDLINKWAFQAETILHGKPSGIDNSICTYGGALFFQAGKIVEKIKTLPNIQILLINTEVPRNTKHLVANTREKMDKYPDILGPIMETIGAISAKQWAFFKELANSNQKDNVDFILKDLVSMNQHLLNCIGVGHPKLDQICQIANELSLPSKLTGAGGGGCAIVFVDKGKDVSEAQKHFLQAGFTVYKADLAGKGVCFM